MTKNVIVIDEWGNEVGTTYPKRAKGLVNKGRAVFADDHHIRLLENCPSEHLFLEDKIMKNTILFNPRNWKFNAETEDNVGERSYITDFDGINLIEAYTIGDAGLHYTEICSNVMTVEPETEYCFLFWANGGANEVGTEICQLQIIPTDGNVTDEELEDKMVYKLNKDFIKPIKKNKSWRMYMIPFKTTQKTGVQLRFAVMEAILTIKPAEVPAEFVDVENVEEAQAQRAANTPEKKLGEYVKQLESHAKNIGSKAAVMGKEGFTTVKESADKFFNSESVKKFGENIVSFFTGEEKKEETDEPAEEAPVEEETVDTASDTEE